MKKPRLYLPRIPIIQGRDQIKMIISWNLSYNRKRESNIHNKSITGNRESLHLEDLKK